MIHLPKPNPHFPMKWELNLFYNEGGELTHAYRIYADETREDLNEPELETLRAAIKEGQECISSSSGQ